MMDSKTWLILFISSVVALIMFIKFVFVPQEWKAKNLISPNLSKIMGEKTVESSPTPTPKQFKFDASTNLKEELEKVNPQVLDSDFE